MGRDFVLQPVPGFMGPGGQMGRNHNILQAQHRSHWMVNMVQRFLGKYIQPAACDLPGFQRIKQGHLIYRGTATDIDELGRIFHFVQ